MKLISICVVGSRDMTDYRILSQVLDGMHLWSPHNVKQFVCGGARGADTLGERWAKQRGYPTVSMPADWDQHGKAAGPIRNAEMAEITDVLVAFWDGHSRGTQHMLRHCHDRGILIYLYKLDGTLWWRTPKEEPLQDELDEMQLWEQIDHPGQTTGGAA